MKALDVRRNPPPPPPPPPSHLLTLVVYPEWEAGALHFGLAPMFQWFSLGHKHKNIRTRIMAYLTRFSIPALLNPTINKMADEASAIVAFDMFA